MPSLICLLGLRCEEDLIKRSVGRSVDTRLANSLFLHLVLAVSKFTKAVESKQVAEQDAERAKFVVMLAEQV